MQNWLAKLYHFIKQNPIVPITIILAALYCGGAVWLWIGAISHYHPGPAIAAAGLAVVILLLGVVIDKLHTQNTELSRQVMVIDELHAQNTELSRQVGELQKRLEVSIHLPRVVG